MEARAINIPNVSIFADLNRHQGDSMMQTSIQERTDDQIAAERAWARAIFRSAYGKYRAMRTRTLCRVQNPERMTAGGGGASRFEPTLWMRDFQLAGRHILKGIYLQMFDLHYLGPLDREETMRKLDIYSLGAWNNRRHILEERVGGELERHRLWPISEWSARSLEISELVRSASNVSRLPVVGKPGSRHACRWTKVPNLDGQ